MIFIKRKSLYKHASNRSNPQNAKKLKCSNINLAKKNMIP